MLSLHLSCGQGVPTPLAGVFASLCTSFQLCGHNGHHDQNTWSIKNNQNIKKNNFKVVVCSCYIYFATKAAPPLLAAVFVAFLQKFAIL